MAVSARGRTAHGSERVRAFLLRTVDRPIITVFGLALLVRVVAAIASNLFVDGVLIPDERTYLRIADLNSTGDLQVEPTLRCLDQAPGPTWCSYWRRLVGHTRPFSWPLTGLFWMFGPHRIIGQLLAGLFGALTAAATAQLAGLFLRKPFALGAGLLVALLPSQVIFSSVVLRESTIWLCVVSLSVLLGLSAKQNGRGQLFLSAAAMAVLFVLLTWLRMQTALLALWCAIPIFALVGRNRRIRVLYAVVVLVGTPILVGVGPAGSAFVTKASGRLGIARDVMSFDAETAFDYTAWAKVPTAGQIEVPGWKVEIPGVKPAMAWGGYVKLPSTQGGKVELPPKMEVELSLGGQVEPPPEGKIRLPSGGQVRLPSGEQVEVPPGAQVELSLGETVEIPPGGLVELSLGGQVEVPPGGEVELPEGSEAHITHALRIMASQNMDATLVDSLSVLPSGLYNTMVRPVLWRPSDLRSASASYVLAGLEAPLWIAFYFLAAIGVFMFYRRVSVIGFPVLFVLAIAVSGAVSHGNLGTAFRHREQVVFAVGVLGFAGLEAVVDRRRMARSQYEKGGSQGQFPARGDQHRDTRVL